MKLYPVFAALGAALAYFLDPQNGKRRRHVTAEAYGVAKKATHLREQEKPQPNDATLTSKVESEIFRDADVPKGQISINAEQGVVYLRGEVGSPDLITRLEQAARDVQGVRDVENLLHSPGSQAPKAG